MKNVCDELLELQQRKEKESEELSVIEKDYQKIKLILEQKNYARKRRKNIPTNFDMIRNSMSSTRYPDEKKPTTYLSTYMEENKERYTVHGILFRVRRITQ